MNRNLFYCLITVYLLMIFFYSLNSGLTCTNDGSHFALVNSMVERGSFELEDNVRFARHDSAISSGKYYSDRAPGFAFFLYLFNHALSPVKNSMQMINFDDFAFLKTDYSEDQRICLLQLAPAFCCTALFLVIFFLLRQLSYKLHVSILVAAGFCTGTIFLRYGTLLYSHIFTSLLVTLSFLLAISYARDKKIYILCTSTFLLAYAVISEYMTIFLFLPLFIFYIYKCRRNFLNIRHFTAFLVSGMIPATLLMSYNYMNFGSPFSLAQFHHSTYVFYHDAGAIFFGTDFLTNARTLLFYSPKYVTLFGGSIFLVIIFLLPFTYHALKKTPGPEHILFLSGFLIASVSIFSYTLCTGGLDLNYRHMLFAVPLLSPLVAEVFSSIEELSARFNRKHAYVLFILIFFIALLYSFQFQLRHLRSFFQARHEFLSYNITSAVNNCSFFMFLLVVYIAIALSVRGLMAANKRSRK
ncbi:MAG TPA: hypothetical protein DET40_05610 [Lentisphaeria bacterium]|nr:MAG: hypothetical protein A2X45_12350 [Lentisphaerae bacterium GWF2_50_93]HCE43003.1 hypothetical protein [Lentisphaeria bacterium]